MVSPHRRHQLILQTTEYREYSLDDDVVDWNKSAAREVVEIIIWCRTCNRDVDGDVIYDSERHKDVIRLSDQSQEA